MRRNQENYLLFFMLLYCTTAWSFWLLSHFPPLSPPFTWPPALLCSRATPWLWARWGRAAGEFRRTGSLQRRDRTFPKALQVQQLWSSWIIWCAHSYTPGKSVPVLTCGFFWIAAEIEKSQPVNIPDAAKRKKKKRTRATDSSTGTFDGNDADIIVRHINIVLF